MTLFASISVLLLSVAIVLSRPRYGITRVVINNQPSGALARRLLLASTLLPVVLGLVGLVSRRDDFFSRDSSFAFVAVASVIILVAIVWVSANAIGMVERELIETVEDLREIQQKLSSALKIRDEFLSIASHELKTPLTSLKIQLQVAQRAKVPTDPSQRSQLVSACLRQTYSLIDLVNSLLDVSRIRA